MDRRTLLTGLIGPGSATKVLAADDDALTPRDPAGPHGNNNHNPLTRDDRCADTFFPAICIAAAAF